MYVIETISLQKQTYMLIAGGGDVISKVARGAWRLADLGVSTQQLEMVSLQHVEHCIGL